MRGPRTLSLYVAREVMQYMLLGLAAIGLVMLGRGLVRVMDELLGAGFRLADLLTVLRLLGTVLMVYAVPVAFLFGVLLAIGRLASDVEITAMRACGVGVLGILAPVALLGLAFSALTLELALDVEPAARREMATALRQMLVRGASLSPGRFSTLGDRTLYVDEREGTSRLRGVVISDRSDPERPFIVFAESGEIELDADDARLTLRLERGDIHVDAGPQESERHRRVAFDRLEYEIDVARTLGISRGRRARELPAGELRETIARIEAGEADSLREAPPLYATNLQRRYARSAAPLLFSLVGVPLGMRRTRGARSFGVILCAGLAFVYYGLQSFGEYLSGEAAVVPAWLALWTPNVLFAAVGVALLARARRGV